MNFYLATHSFTEKEDDWGYKSFITVQKLRADGLLVGDFFRARVDLTIFGQPESSITSRLQRNHCGLR